jgi:DNA-binding NtrC family response regulator
MTLSPDAIDYLRGYVYEGNVRELQGMIERAVVICEGKTISVDELAVMPHPERRNQDDENPSFFAEGKTLKDMEENYIEYVFKKTNGSIKDSSAILGIDRSTLWRRIKKTPVSISRTD